MMIAEIVGGLWFGSVVLIADGLHMSTHAGALLRAALAYTYSRRYAHDERLAFGTGKFGDLAAFSRASNGKDYIETVWGRGYVLREPLDDEARISA